MKMYEIKVWPRRTIEVRLSWWQALASVAAILLSPILAPALAQIPSTQCVSSAIAGGTSDALTLPLLPCSVTTTLLTLKVSLTNQTTTPTMQMVGAPALPIRRSDGSAVAVGELVAGDTLLFTNNGSSWLKLIKAPVVTSSVTPTVPNTGLAPYTGQVATRGYLSDNLNTTNKQMMSRTAHFARDNINSLSVVVHNFYVADTVAPNNGAEVGSGAPASVTASIEYPAGVFTQVKFGGAATGTVLDGSLLTSDPTSVSIPYGDKFWVRIWFSGAAGIVFTASAPAMPNGDDGLNFGVTTADLTMTAGTIGLTNTLGAVSMYFPAAIVATTTRPAVCEAGDSRVVGLRDSGDETGDTGEFSRSIGPAAAYLNLAVTGDAGSVALANYTQRLALSNYCSHFLVNYGINDLIGGSQTAAQVIQMLQEFVALWPSKQVWISTLPPVSTSTDGWASLAGQTTSAQNANRVGVNSAIRSGGITGAKGFLEIADVVESGRDSGLWKAPSFTNDGIHELLLADRAIQSSGVVTIPVLGSPSAGTFTARCSAGTGPDCPVPTGQPNLLINQAMALDQANEGALLLQTGDTHTNTTIDNLPAWPPRVIGQIVKGVGVVNTPPTTVTALPTSTSVTISQATTASATVALSFSGVPLVSGGASYIVDGWQAALNSTAAPTIAAVNCRQVNDGPPGILESLFCETTTAASAVAAPDYLLVQAPIVASKLTGLGFGTTSAVPLCASWWVKSSLSPYIQGFAFQNISLSPRSYSAAVPITAPGKWTQEKVCFSGDTVGTWVTSGSAGGARLVLSFAAGSSGLGAPGVFGPYVAYGATGASNSMLTTLGGNFQVTQVKLEVGSVVTPVVPRSMGEELALAQPFFEKSYSQGIPLATITSVGMDVFPQQVSQAYQPNWAINFKVPKNSLPSMSIWSPTTGASGKAVNFDGGANVDFVLALQFLGDKKAIVNAPAPITAVLGGYFGTQWSADARIP